MTHEIYEGGVYRICKKFEFSAAHHLPLMPDGHKCKRVHGHNYVVSVVIESDKLDDVGMVVDFGELKIFKSWLDVTLDHHDLNERLNGIHPTSENLCKHFYDHLLDRFNVVKVRVSETDGTWAEYINCKKPA